MYLYNSICCKAIWWPIISCPLGNAQSPQKAHLNTQKFFCTSSYFFIPFWPTASERMILCQLICMRGELYEYFIIISGEQPSSSSSSSSSVESNHYHLHQHHHHQWRGTKRATFWQQETKFWDPVLAQFRTSIEWLLEPLQNSRT